MSLDTDNSRPCHGTLPGKIRLLFGATGWPSGMLEVASWASREGLAEPTIAEILPGCGFRDESTTQTAATRYALSALGGPFIEKLTERAPHVVGFRIEGGQLDQVKGLVRAVRLLSDAEIVLGGPTATSHPEEVLQDTEADYVFAGEAEQSFGQFLQLAAAGHSRDSLPEIPGAAYRYGGRVYQNTLPSDGYRRTVLDADRSSIRGPTIRGPTIRSRALRQIRNRIRPVVPAELIEVNRLDWSLLEDFQGEFDSLFFTGGRGCPGDCTFCGQSHGREVRVKSARHLLEEIEAADALVANGRLKLTRWELFEHVDDPAFRGKRVGWAAVYDEDFFLKRHRAIEFFELWDGSPLKDRYRISLQTNPRSMLTAGDEVDAELLGWIDRVKPMVQLGAESFHPELLARWRKRHDLNQLNTVLDALDATRQDYTVFQLLTDFDTTPEELVETLRRLILAAYRHRRMRIASSPFTIPLYDSTTRELLEHRGLLGPDRVRHFTDYERPQPGWMDPLAAELADLADAELQFALQPTQRDGALVSAMEVVTQRIRVEASRAETASAVPHLHDQAVRALYQIRDARFQEIGRTARR